MSRILRASRQPLDPFQSSCRVPQLRQNLISMIPKMLDGMVSPSFLGRVRGYPVDVSSYRSDWRIRSALSSPLSSPVRASQYISTFPSSSFWFSCSVHFSRLIYMPVRPLSPCLGPNIYSTRHHNGFSGRALALSVSPETVFDIATFLVMPLYGMMLFAPKSQFTRKVIGSRLPFMIAAVAYLFLLLLWGPLAFLVEMASKTWCSNALPDVVVFGKLFNKHIITSLTWLHLVTLDFFQARYVMGRPYA